MPIQVIPDGQPYNQVEITLKTGTDSEQELRVYCRYTKLLLSSEEDGTFERTIENHWGDDGEIMYHATVHGDRRTVEIDVQNSLRVADPCKAQEPGQARLAVTFQAADGSQRHIPLALVAPPYRWVDVHFSADADGKGTFEYAQDINPEDNPPSIWCPQDGSVYFTLTGAEFYRKEPFYFDAPDSCIVDVGTNGKEAILTNLHKDEAEKQGHCFYIQVIDSKGEVCRSEDPTIVNVSVSDPPEGGYREA